MNSFIHRMRNRAEDDRGFTLVELLVVILIIGILAAIAIPTFLGQRAKGQDADAKSNARNAVSLIEACFSTEETYGAPCNTETGLAGDGSTPGVTGLDFGAGPGQVTVTSGTTTGFVITAKSKSGTDFVITKTGGSIARTCTDPGKGACPSGTGGSGVW